MDASDTESDLVLFVGVQPGYCHECRREFEPTDLVYFGERTDGGGLGGYARVGECCRWVLCHVVFREIRRPGRAV